MSSDDRGMDCIFGVCLLAIFVMVIIMMSPIGVLVFIVFAVLVRRDIAEQMELKKSSLSREMRQKTAAEGGPTIVQVDRRIIYQVPSKCPECGVSLSNEEVDWVGPLQAKCPFCGTTVEVQSTEF